MTTILYKLTQSSLLTWSILTSNSKVIITHGTHNGKQQTDTHECLTPHDAAIEMDRRIHIKKTKQGYTEEIPDAVPQLPMLAVPYQPGTLHDYIYIQPKLDGIRCVATASTMITRRGEPIHSVPHIAQALSTLPPGIRLDGELYCHGRSFQDHLSIIKRGDYHPDFYKIIYNVFDIQVEGVPFSQRLLLYEQIVKDLNSQYVEIVPTTLLPKASISTYAKEHFSSHEGAILRNPAALYVYNYRHPGLQKYKWSYTDECQITDIICSSTGREEGAAIYVCTHPTTGRSFKVRPKLDLYRRKHLYSIRDQIIGYYTRVTYEGLSTKGVPLKPRAEGYAKTKEGLQ